jgi:DNA-binding transcriptional LysR family regulator
MDLDLRKLRYFAAVAERLHFGRAAAALHITQPSLSRQIRQLEHDIGVELFVRTSRDVALTPAGEQLFHDAEQLLAASRAALDRSRRAGSGGRSLTVGFMFGTDVTPTLRAFAERHPGTELKLDRLHWWNQCQALLNGQVDVAFLRLPVAAEELSLLPLYVEQFTAALPASHALADRTAVLITELADDPVLRYADASPAWNAFWTIDPRADGTQPRRGPFVHDMEEIVEHIRAGHGIVFLPAPVAAAFPRRDIAYVPVSDVPPGRIVLAWQAGRRSSLITALAEAARETFGFGGS